MHPQKPALKTHVGCSTFSSDPRHFPKACAGDSPSEHRRVAYEAWRRQLVRSSPRTGPSSTAASKRPGASAMPRMRSIPARFLISTCAMDGLIRQHMRSFSFAETSLGAIWSAGSMHLLLRQHPRIRPISERAGPRFDSRCWNRLDTCLECRTRR